MGVPTPGSDEELDALARIDQTRAEEELSLLPAHEQRRRRAWIRSRW